MSGPSSSGPASSGQFGSRLGFILAAAGSAIGLGNIWRFPYTVGESGGAAFVLVYLGFVALIGVPVLLAELAIGRASGKNPVGAFRALGGRHGEAWAWVGRLGVLTGFGILSFYSVIAGWTLSYLWRALSGEFAAVMSPAQSGAIFEEIIANPGEVVTMAGVFLLLTALVVRGGVSGGIERAAKVLMPVFFVILLVLAGRAVTLPGGGEGLRFLFEPDFSKLSGTAVMSALGQALFSLSLGMGAMITYGSYLQKKEGLGVAGISVALFDTGIALLAGLIIFPALFSVGAEPSAGPGLVFVAMPAIFDQLPAGQAFGVAFYALLAVAALTSTISLLEVVVAYVVGERGIKRETAVWLVTGLCFVVAVPSALSQGAVEGLGAEGLGGQSFLDLMNIVFGNISLSLGALLIAIFAGWTWGVVPALEEMNGMSLGGLWAAAIKFLCPIAIAGVMGYILVTGRFF